MAPGELRYCSAEGTSVFDDTGDNVGRLKFGDYVIVLNDVTEAGEYSRIVTRAYWRVLSILGPVWIHESYIR